MPEKGESNASWRKLLAESVVSGNHLNSAYVSPGISSDRLAAVIKEYPIRINPYFLSLIKKPGDAIARQVIPDPAELDQFAAGPDPLCEESQSPVENLVHRYPDRVLFLVSGECAVYCRHCMRKRNAGTRRPVLWENVEKAVDYVRRKPGIREVILSGGDPLLLPESFLKRILLAFQGIRHVRRLRIHTRVPCVLPQRVTPGLVRLLRRFSPLYLNIQFNHPDELTTEAAGACGMLADAGIVLGSQTVLLKHVNDDPAVMIDLMEKLLCCRVRPYYLHHPDPVRGTMHFGVTVETGLGIMDALRGRVSGMGIPQYVIDRLGGRGKVPVTAGVSRETS